MTVGPFDRGTSLAALADQSFDVLVIGGGITGAGVALDAASRGLKTALVEKGDFASGTSSKSSKLVHGGLRYLQQGDVRLVYEALRERQRLLRNAPHLVDVLPFLIPMFGRDGVIHPKLARALGSAMWMYDLTGGARIGKLHKRISAEETMAHMPTLPPGRVAASYLYYDARADDARLTMTIARTAAVLHGAVCVNHAPVVELLRRGVHVNGAVVEAHGRRIDVRARQVVNATGVWADEVRTLDEGRDPDTIRPAKGIHLTVPWSLVQNDIAVVAPVPKDKRSVFVVPWPTAPGRDPEFTYIGTTDTDHDGPLDDPQCTRDDVEYLLRAINHSTTTEITEADVVGTWAGLRPLVKSPSGGSGGRTADLSRNHSVTASPSGMITVTGGKLTTYREMASDTVDAVAKRLDLPRSQRKSRTEKQRLLGADGFDPDATGPSGHLHGRFGGEAPLIEAMVARDRSLGDPLVPGLPYLRAEAVYSARYEMAATLDDVLSRRTRALLLGRDAAAAVAADVADLVGDELGWDEATRKREVDAFRAKAAQERDPLDLVG